MRFRSWVRWSCTPIRRTTTCSAAELLADLRRCGDLLQAPERLDARIAVADRRVVRTIGAVQADSVDPALVVTEADGLAVRKFSTGARGEAAGIAVHRADGNGGPVE